MTPVLERGGMRRTWLRGRENVHKRYLVHVAGHNLGILMRALFGAGTPREAANVRFAFLFLIQDIDTIAFVILAASDVETAALIVAITGEADCSNRDIFTGLLRSEDEKEESRARQAAG